MKCRVKAMTERQISSGDVIEESSIAAQSGTPEFRRQIECQGVRAADNALRMWIVRVGCGFLAS